jgi:ketosteroid isomerase-like protein
MNSAAARAAIYVCALLLASTLLVFAQSNAPKNDEEGTILALENAWNLAEAHKDGNALDQLLADNLVYTDIDGSFMNKAQFIKSAKESTVQGMSLNNEGVKVQFYGDAAVVSGLYRERGSEKGKPYARSGRFTDVWIKQNATWLCVASQSTLIQK